MIVNKVREWLKQPLTHEYIVDPESDNKAEYTFTTNTCRYNLAHLRPNHPELQLAMWVVHEMCHWALDNDVNRSLDNRKHNKDWIPVMEQILNHIYPKYDIQLHA